MAVPLEPRREPLRVDQAAVFRGEHQLGPGGPEVIGLHTLSPFSRERTFTSLLCTVDREGRPARDFGRGLNVG